jgi:hypothetical protein
MRCEVLLQLDTIMRGRKILRAMMEAGEGAGVEIVETRRYVGDSEVLMSYGLGHPVRKLWTDTHVRNGGRLIGWDLGYWLRDVPATFSMRCTLDADHPHKWIRPEPGDRWEQSGIKLRHDAKPDGPVVLVGLGRKQRVHMGLFGQAWEHQKLKELRHRFPGREVVYRPKTPEPMQKVRVLSDMPIEQVLRGASLVVCHHSNVAIDACIAGVPVECEDGAAFALYRDNPDPSPEQRLGFLQSLAWWQWNQSEALEAWKYLRGRMEQ